MNVYGRATTDGKRKAHDKVIQMVQSPEKSEPVAKSGLMWSREERFGNCKPFRILAAGTATLGTRFLWHIIWN
jgi:hypothetical protein